MWCPGPQETGGAGVSGQARFQTPDLSCNRWSDALSERSPLSSFSGRELSGKRHLLARRVSDPQSLDPLGVFPNFQLLDITASSVLRPSRLTFGPNIPSDVGIICFPERALITCPPPLS